MIDSPWPSTLPSLPAPTLTTLEKAGLFDGLHTMGRKIPEATREHFLQSVASLEKWSPVFMNSSSGKPEGVDVVWGQAGVLEDMNEEQRKISEESWERESGVATKAKDWLFGTREGYGPEGWDRILGESNVVCYVIEGNHF